MVHLFEQHPIAPMKGTSGDLPDADGWVYELKWDGMRIIAYVTADDVVLRSSNGRNVTASFPELANLSELAEGYDGLILDGEVVAFDGDRPSFHALQHRMHISDSSEAARRAIANPVIFVCFDLLHLDGHDTIELPLAQRRSLLEQVFANGPHRRLCQQHTEGAAELLAAVVEADLEGVMAKRVDSVYQPGRRSTSWVKHKPRKRQEFVVGGWLSGRGRRSGGLGSLLLGFYDDEGFQFAGSAGSGLDERSIDAWQARLNGQTECPFVARPEILLDGRELHWCMPTEIVEIEFSEWPEGQQLRHPVVLGHRDDKDPLEVVREQ